MDESIVHLPQVAPAVLGGAQSLVSREDLRERRELVQRVPLITGDAEVKLDIHAQAKGIFHVELGDGVQRYSGSIVFE